MEGLMWLGQVKFFCTQCGKEMTDAVQRRIEQRCKELSIDPAQLGDKAREAARTEMLREWGEAPAAPAELAFIKATAFLLLELAYSPALLCNDCRSPQVEHRLENKVKLHLIKGGKTEE
jgi:hypothetical protein